MSRTDGHEPYWVRAARDGVALHDHSNGVCDLSEDRSDYKQQWSHHALRKCAKYVRYNVVCLHRYSEYEVPGSGLEKVFSNKRHEAYIYDSDGNLVETARPTLPLCHKTVSSSVYVCKDGGFASYEKSNVLYRFWSRTKLYAVNHELGRHDFELLVRDDSLPCSCDSEEPRPFSKCQVVPKTKSKSSRRCNCCNDGEDAPRSRVKQSLKTLAALSFVDDDDSYPDLEDVYVCRGHH